VRASAGFNSEEKKNTVVLKFVREAYDVKVDSDIAQVLNTANVSGDAGIVSSVTYGQFGIVEIQSDSSLSDIHAALDFSFNVDPTVTISGNARTKLNETLNSLSIKGIFKGVQGNNSLTNIASVNDLKNILSGNGAFTQTTPVVPLSFVIKSLKTGATMMLKTSLTYTKRECVSASSTSPKKTQD